MNEGEITYWMVAGIILGAAVVGVFVARYIYDITTENREIKRQNERMKSYMDFRARNNIGMGDK